MPVKCKKKIAESFPCYHLDYEFVKDFWYPTKHPKWVADKFGQGVVDLSQACITLAEIPFIRLRGSIDSNLLVNMASVSLSKTVGLLKQTFISRHA